MHAAESSLRSCWSYSWLIITQHFMELEVSLLCSHGPYPLLVESSSQAVTLFKNNFNVTIPCMPTTPKVISSSQVFWLKFCAHFSPPVCVLDHVDHYKNIWWRVQIMKFLIMEFCILSLLKYMMSQLPNFTTLPGNQIWILFTSAKYTAIFNTYENMCK
jgi:hypothetical protein